MNIIDKNFNIKGVSLILGFFDGIHCGHRKVIKQAVDFAKENNAKTLLLTFKESPAQYFNKDFNYIFPRKVSYKKIEELGVDYLLEIDFEKVVKLTAEEYLSKLVEKFAPISITTGFNHTFGAGKLGTPFLLELMSKKDGYKYFCVKPYKIGNEAISSTLIKEYLKNGCIENANKLLCSNFTLKLKIIQGEKIGRQLGFPTANAQYPQNIIKLPYGVYKTSVLNKPAIMNWGVKPTFNNKKEILEIHILNGFNDNLYDKNLEVTILQKIRDEIEFDSKEDLINQIKKDIKSCLES